MPSGVMVPPRTVTAWPTGRAERTVMAIAGTEVLKRLQPLKVFPEHNSQLIPSGTWMLFTVNGKVIARAGPSRMRRGPAYCPRP